MHREFGEQLTGRGRGIRDERVLAAMAAVPRESFVPEETQRHAYEDRPLGIGEGQTISQPFIVAMMSEALGLEGDERVLEVGTGSGYQAAVLAEMGCEVFSIERIASLSERAAEALLSAGYDSVHLRVGDGALGWPEEAPFDAVIVTCAAPTLPDRLLGQLRAGGKMVIPVGRDGGAQELLLLEKGEDGSVSETRLLAVRFVPLVRDGSS